MADAQLRIQVMATKARLSSPKCYFLTKDGEVHEIVCDLEVIKIDGRLGFMESDHVFLLYAHGLSAVFQRDDGEHNLSIYSSCREALFEFSHVDKDLQPIPNCKIKMCGVHLLYLEEESTQISGVDSLNEAGLVESGGDGIQNIVEDEEVPNSTTLEEEGTEHKSESEIDTLLLGNATGQYSSHSVHKGLLLPPENGLELEPACSICRFWRMFTALVYVPSFNINNAVSEQEKKSTNRETEKLFMVCNRDVNVNEKKRIICRVSKTILHAMWDCKSFKQARKPSKVLMRGKYRDFFDLVLDFSSAMREEELELLCTIVWKVWSLPNAKIHGELVSDVCCVAAWAKSFLLEYNDCSPGVANKQRFKQTCLGL
ncbi:hypothetical protein Q3G72_007522 [Acer saccharum]|nr:hypothetical protein Q3G72_007522 [Acer saccharum]